jgi:hypothetical protein
LYHIEVFVIVVANDRVVIESILKIENYFMGLQQQQIKHITLKRNSIVDTVRWPSPVFALGSEAIQKNGERERERERERIIEREID